MLLMAGRHHVSARRRHLSVTAMNADRAELFLCMIISFFLFCRSFDTTLGCSIPSMLRYNICMYHPSYMARLPQLRSRCLWSSALRRTFQPIRLLNCKSRWFLFFCLFSWPKPRR
ncbi:uncharacterized protein B0J16DRAFT_40285 [Fusarium flagelliforme]|uniref:uncharacterized protein n=1 Tax=Fusarium flagelliforme TaxID=2675880 RepID=UPI001E8EE0E8|nr:uncharacterized protein B0J16DRAFT_40285 [Fusarium flagelliforme]KAH7198531.1 hypothetical protein B0J16DRAFT_40285 [Fusarium flagelliforme]